MNCEKVKRITDEILRIVRPIEYFNISISNRSGRTCLVTTIL